MITSQITGRSVFGADPIGFIPLIPNDSGNTEYIASQMLERQYEYSTVTFDPDLRVVRDNILAQIKADLDANYTPTVFTDPAKNYEVEYQLKSLRLDFEAAVRANILSERTYYYYAKVAVLVNVNL